MPSPASAFARTVLHATPKSRGFLARWRNRRRFFALNARVCELYARGEILDGYVTEHAGFFVVRLVVAADFDLAILPHLATGGTHAGFVPMEPRTR